MLGGQLSIGLEERSTFERNFNSDMRSGIFFRKLLFKRQVLRTWQSAIWPWIEVRRLLSSLEEVVGLGLVYM